MKGLYNFVLHSFRNLVTEEQLKKNAKYSGVLSIPSNILYHPKYHLKIKSYPERWENIKWYDGMMWCQYMYICIYVDIYIYIYIYTGLHINVYFIFHFSFLQIFWLFYITVEGYVKQPKYFWELKLFFI